MNGRLRKEFEYFIAHHGELVSKYNGRVVVIADQKVFGDYDNELKAIAQVEGKLPQGTFIVQRVAAEEESYTQTFHSHASFA